MQRMFSVFQGQTAGQRQLTTSCEGGSGGDEAPLGAAFTHGSSRLSSTVLGCQQAAAAAALKDLVQCCIEFKYNNVYILKHCTCL